MTFLAYLAAQGDANAASLAADLSGLADGANDLGVVVAHLRSTLGGSEAVLAVEEAAYRWREWHKAHGPDAQIRKRLRQGRLSQESSPE